MEGKWTAGLALLVVLSAPVAGCGGSGAARTAPPLRTFVDRVDRICRDATTEEERVTRLRRLRPAAAVKDLYGHWMRAEKDALAAADALENPPEQVEGDPRVPLVIAQGKIAGYAGRIGAEVCAAVTMRP